MYLFNKAAKRSHFNGKSPRLFYYRGVCGHWSLLSNADVWIFYTAWSNKILINTKSKISLTGSWARMTLTLFLNFCFLYRKLFDHLVLNFFNNFLKDAVPSRLWPVRGWRDNGMEGPVTLPPAWPIPWPVYTMHSHWTAFHWEPESNIKGKKEQVPNYFNHV